MWIPSKPRSVERLDVAARARANCSRQPRLRNLLRPGRGGLTVLMLSTVLLFSMGASVSPLEGQSSSALSESAQAELRDQIESAYEVLPVAGGVLLRPLDEIRGVRSIELSGPQIAVNGEPVTESVLRAWLDEAAAPLISLANLESSQRRVLFDLPPLESDLSEAVEEESSAGLAAEEPDTSEGDEVEQPKPPEAPKEPKQPKPEGSSTTHLGTSFTVGETVVVEEGESRREVTVSGGSLIVRGRIERNATVFSGTAEIDGEVGGDVVAIGGSVVLGPDAEVDGDVTSVLGSVTRDPGAYVGGDISEMSMVGPVVRELIRERGRGRVDFNDFRGARHNWRPVHRITDFLFDLFSWIVVGLIILLAVFLARGPIERVELRFSAEPVRALVAGLLACLFFFPLLLIAIVVLAVSIIGIPVLIFLILFMVFVFPFLLVILGLIGYLGVAKWIGHFLGRRFEWSLTPYTAALLGAGALWSFLLISNFLSIFGGPVEFFTAMFAIAGLLLNMLAVIAGLGTWLLILVDGRRNRASAVVPPPPNSTGWHGADPAQGWQEPGTDPRPDGFSGSGETSESEDDAWQRDPDPPAWDDDSGDGDWQESPAENAAPQGDSESEPEEDSGADDKDDRERP